MFDDYVAFRLENLDECQLVAAQIKSGEVNRDTKALHTKIANHAARFAESWTTAELVDRIIEDDLVASFFAKDPKRQNKSEASVVSKFQLHNREIESLPNGGPNSITVYEGKIHKGERINGCKSVDFRLNNWLCGHKTTDSRGGAQDNQFNDLCEFIKQAVIYCERNQDEWKFAALCDGNYYTPEKRQFMTQLAGTQLDKIWIGTTNEFIKATAR